MEAYEFKTKVKDGMIQIPKKYTNKIASTVKVIILSGQAPWHKDIIDELLEHPVKVDNFRPLLRDKIYESR